MEGPETFLPERGWVKVAATATVPTLIWTRLPFVQ